MYYWIGIGVYVVLTAWMYWEIRNAPKIEDHD